MAGQVRWLYGHPTALDALRNYVDGAQVGAPDPVLVGAISPLALLFGIELVPDDSLPAGGWRLEDVEHQQVDTGVLTDAAMADATDVGKWAKGVLDTAGVTDAASPPPVEHRLLHNGTMTTEDGVLLERYACWCTAVGDWASPEEAQAEGLAHLAEAGQRQAAPDLLEDLRKARALLDQDRAAAGLADQLDPGVRAKLEATARELAALRPAWNPSTAFLAGMAPPMAHQQVDANWQINHLVGLGAYSHGQRLHRCSPQCGYWQTEVWPGAEALLEEYRRAGFQPQYATGSSGPAPINPAEGVPPERLVPCTECEAGYLAHDIGQQVWVWRPHAVGCAQAQAGAVTLTMAEPAPVPDADLVGGATYGLGLVAVGGKPSTVTLGPGVLYMAPIGEPTFWQWVRSWVKHPRSTARWIRNRRHPPTALGKGWVELGWTDDGVDLEYAAAPGDTDQPSKLERLAVALAPEAHQVWAAGIAEHEVMLHDSPWLALQQYERDAWVAAVRYVLEEQAGGDSDGSEVR